MLNQCRCHCYMIVFVNSWYCNTLFYITLHAKGAAGPNTLQIHQILAVPQPQCTQMDYFNNRYTVKNPDFLHYFAGTINLKSHLIAVCVTHLYLSVPIPHVYTLPVHPVHLHKAPVHLPVTVPLTAQLDGEGRTYTQLQSC
jgi:hypothetical protein